MTDAPATSPFRIFRADQGVSLRESGSMTTEPFTEVQAEGLQRLVDAGFHDGEETTVLVDIPGFHLTHVWFKMDFPLPLHSHDADCLYYIVAGSIRMGTEDLGPRDSFFLPAGTPYTYKPGPDGVELLEFRTANAFNFLGLAKGAAFWDRAVEAVRTNRATWQEAAKPRLNAG